MNQKSEQPETQLELQGIDAPDYRDLLTELATHGRPLLMMQQDMTWHCRVELFTIHKNSEFTVKSDFMHDNASEALQLCLTRIEETKAGYTIAEVGDGATK